jgi:1-aminocyclopropane-1-carboxylate deaminase
LLTYQQPPIQEIHDPLLIEKGIRLLVRREDLNHPRVSGNKWWKLKYNLARAVEEKHHAILTFGGAFSNHIYATAAAAKEININCIGIIRGEASQPLNHTLTFARQSGMQLHYVTREAYRQKTSDAFIQELTKSFGEFYLIPEGGTNELALEGTRDWGNLISETSFDYVTLPVGTGGTIAGLIKAMPNRNILGISTLKGDFLENEIKQLLAAEKNFEPVYGNWELLTSYHHGGYAKTSQPLLEFIRYINARHALPLDQVYTGKMMWAIWEEIKRDRFTRGTTILAIHTGGLQGVLPELY